MSVDILGTNCDQCRSIVLLYVHRNCKAHKDGKPRTATSTFTQLLNSESVGLGLSFSFSRSVRNVPLFSCCYYFAGEREGGRQEGWEGSCLCVACGQTVKHWCRSADKLLPVSLVAASFGGRYLRTMALRVIEFSLR